MRDRKSREKPHPASRDARYHIWITGATFTSRRCLFAESQRDQRQHLTSRDRGCQRRKVPVFWHAACPLL